MFVVVHKGRVVLGPMGWKQKYFTDVLKIRHNTKVDVPGVAPEVLPLAIGENTAIHRVIINQPEIDTAVEYLYGPIWDLSSDTVVANYEIRDLSVVDARNNFRTIAATERYKKEIAGFKLVVKDTEVFIDTSRESRTIFVQKVLSMEDYDVVNWKFAEGWISLSKKDLIYIVSELNKYIQAAFDWEKLVNTEIDSATNKEQLKSISMS